MSIELSLVTNDASTTGTEKLFIFDGSDPKTATISSLSNYLNLIATNIDVYRTTTQASNTIVTNDLTASTTPLATAQTNSAAIAAELATIAINNAKTSSVNEYLSGITAQIHRCSNAITKSWIYDTTRDSDGGAWRLRTNDKSWSKEELSGTWLGNCNSELEARDNFRTLNTANLLVDDSSTFTNSVGKWYASVNCTIKSNLGRLRITATAATPLAMIPIDTVVGVRYILKGEFISINSAPGKNVFLGVGSNNSGSDLAAVTCCDGTVSAYHAYASFVATTTTSWVRINATGCSVGDVIDFDDIVVKPASNNIVTDPENFTTSKYINTLIAVYPNVAMAPDGSMTANKIIPQATLGSRYLANSAETLANSVTSIYLAKSELIYARFGNAAGYVTVNLNTGTLSATTNGGCYFTIEAAQFGYWKISCINPTATAYQTQLFVGVDSAGTNIATNGTDGVYAWGLSVSSITGNASNYSPSTANLLTNGAFTNATGWTLAANQTVANGVLNFSSQNNTFVTTPFTFTAGKAYLISCDVTITNGSIRLPYDGQAQNIKLANKNGTYKHAFVSTGNTTLYALYGDNSNAAGTIDNISIQEIANVNLPYVANSSMLNAYWLDQTTACFFKFTNKYNYASDPYNLPAASWNKVAGCNITGLVLPYLVNLPNVGSELNKPVTLLATVGSSATGAMLLSGQGTITLGVRSDTGTTDVATKTITLTNTPTLYYVSLTIASTGRLGYQLFLSRGTSDTATQVTVIGAGVFPGTVVPTGIPNTTTSNNNYLVGQNYIETTRGNGKLFPVVAAVLSEGNNVIIYDISKPDCPMWMKFYVTNGNWAPAAALTSFTSVNDIKTLNGTIYIANGNSDGGLTEIRFIEDAVYKRITSQSYGGKYFGNIAERHLNKGYNSGNSQHGYPTLYNSNYLNSIAVAVIGNPPIDINSGLPIPTVAVGGDNQVTVFQTNGTSNIVAQTYLCSVFVKFIKDVLYFHSGYAIQGLLCYSLPPYATSSYIGATGGYATGQMFIGDNYMRSVDMNKSYGVKASPYEMTFFKPNIDNPVASPVALVSQEFATGYTTSNKRTYLVDATNNPELLVNGIFDKDLSGWTLSGIVPTWENRKMKFMSDGTTASFADQSFTTVVGRTYTVSGFVSTQQISMYIDSATFLGGNLLTVAIPAGAFSYSFIASTTTTYLRFGDYASSVNYVSDLSIKATEYLGAEELVTNGKFINGSTGWSQVANATLTAPDYGVLRFTNTAGLGNGGGIYQNIPTVIGKAYKLNVNYLGSSNQGNCFINISSTPSNTDIDVGYSVLPFTGINTTKTFIATSTVTCVSITQSSTFNVGDFAAITSVSVKEMLDVELAPTLTSTTGWTAYGCTVAATANGLEITSTQASTCYIETTVDAGCLNSTYRFLAFVRIMTGGGSCYISAGDGNSNSGTVVGPSVLPTMVDLFKTHTSVENKTFRFRFNASAIGEKAALTHLSIKEVCLGSTDLVTNGSFATNTTGWNTGGGAGSSVTWNAAGKADCNSGTNSNICLNQVLTGVVAGKYYLVSAEFSAANTAIAIYSAVGLGAFTNFHATTGIITKYLIIRPTITTPTVQIQIAGGGANSTCTVDNVSVKEIVFGKRGITTVSTTGAGWTPLGTGGIRAAGQTISSSMYGDLPVTYNNSVTYKAYLMTIVVRTINGILTPQCGTLTGTTITTPGIHKRVFYSYAGTYWYLEAATNTTADIEYVNVVPIEGDKTPKQIGQALGIVPYGGMVKTPVALGTQLLGYSGFNYTSYLKEELPSTDLDVGTADWNLSVIANIPSSICKYNYPLINVEKNPNLNWNLGASLVGSVLIPNYWQDYNVQNISSTTVGTNSFIWTATTHLAGIALIANQHNSGESIVEVTIKVRKVATSNGNPTLNIYAGSWYELLGTTATIGQWYIVKVRLPVSYGNAIIISNFNGAATWEMEYCSIKACGNITIAERSGPSGSKISLGINAFGSIIGTVFDGTTTRTVKPVNYTTAIPPNMWSKIELEYNANGNLSLYWNTKLLNTTTGTPLLTLNNTSATLLIGNSYTLDSPFPGSINAFKFTTNIPSMETKAWMYQQDMEMYNPGAQVLAGYLPDERLVTIDPETNNTIIKCPTTILTYNGLVKIKSTVINTNVGTYYSTITNGGYSLTSRDGFSKNVEVVIPTMTVRNELLKRRANAAQKRRTTFNIDSLAGQTKFNVPVGWTLISVSVGNAYKQKGATKDYIVTSDDVREIVVFAVAPGVNTWVQFEIEEI